MEVFLYNSTVCRLCGEENDNGTLLYSSEENNQSLSEIINSYLPIKVLDDGELPRTICPGCTIQLEATVEFLNLIINGQKIIRELYQRESEYKKNVLNTSNKQTPDIISEKIVYEINTSNGVYQVEHPISLQVSGINKPKRKRGRPPKKPKTPEELAQEAEAAKVQAEITPNDSEEKEENSGKRKRKAPTRFKEAVQGKELERIFIEVGVIDSTEVDKKPKPEPNVPKEPEVIGHLEESGELVVVVKGKGRGRPRGRMRQMIEECAVCGQQFSSRGRYMSHVATHGRMRFLCSCGHVFPTRPALQDHHQLTGHEGETVETDNDTPKTPEMVINDIETNTDTISSQNTPVQGLPDLTDASECEIETMETMEPMDEVNIVDVENDTNVIDEKTDDTVQEDPIGIIEVGKGKLKLKCNHCDKLFSNKQSKSLHIKAVHLGVKSYACPECPARFPYPQSLAVHRVSHRRFRPTAGYACDLCGKVLNHPSSVVYHKQAEHAAQRYICGTCGKHFKHKQLLQRHQLVHSQLRPFSCKTCNATFKTKANLLNHQLLHSGIKKFSCDICKMKFSHKTSLTLHMRWHNGSKPYACTECGKSFSQKGNLSEHERIHSGVKPYQCAMCPRRFTTSSQHRLHARRHTRRPAHDRSSSVRRDEAVVRKRKILDRNKSNKQISLLVNDKNQHEDIQQEEPKPIEDETESEERVIYVAYNEDDSESSAFHILDPEQAANIEENKVLTTCELYSGSSLLVPQQLNDLKMEIESDLQLEEQVERIELAPQQVMVNTDNFNVNPVIDEQGNPLHFTMQDGTRLAITSIDGKTLQVITQDGDTIPVEINNYNEEEVEEEVMIPETVVHHINIQKYGAPAHAPVTHYYTIV